MQDSNVDADVQVYWSYSQSSATTAASISLLPHLQTDLAPELEPPSTFLQAVVGTIFAQLETGQHRRL